MSTRDHINEFLSKKHLAVVGASSDPKSISRALITEFQKRGYDIAPVNPNIKDIDGLRCYANVTEIQPGVDAALIMTRPDVTGKIVDDCAQAEIPLLWLYRSVGKGSISEKALQTCREKNIRVIPGYCPFMFLENTGFIHKFHGFLLKLGGKYPR
jgi:predicted CoA-binding protein